MKSNLKHVGFTLLLVLTVFSSYLFFSASRASADENNPVPVQVKEVAFAHCVLWEDYFNPSSSSSEILVPAGSPVVLRLGWFFGEENQGDEFLKGQITNIKIGGTPIENTDLYWSENFSEPYDGAGFLGAYWQFPPIGPLPSGTSLDVEWEIGFSKKVYDGEGTYGPGDTFGGPDRICTIIWQ